MALAALALSVAAAARAPRHEHQLRPRRSSTPSKAVVTEFKYVNPHTQLFFDVTDDKGNVSIGAANCCRTRRCCCATAGQEAIGGGAAGRHEGLGDRGAAARRGQHGLLVLKIENEKGEDLLGGGPNAGGPEPRPAP